MQFWVAAVATVWILSCGAELKEFDTCKRLGKAGMCRSYSSCKNQPPSRRFTICSYNAREPVICCPLIRIKNAKSNQVSVTIAEDSNPRIAVKKCNEYRKLSYNRLTLSPLTLIPTALSFKVLKCENIANLIVGGNITKPGEFPHMAAIGWRYGRQVSFDCGGSLISDRYVLTASHCKIGKKGTFPSFVRLGDQNLVRTDDGAKPMDVDIDTFVRHPKFKYNQGLYHDIALIRLVKSVTFDNFIRPACLYDKQKVPAEQVIATGFGVTGYLGDKSDELLKVSLNIYDNQVCSKGYANSRELRKGLQPSQLCVGSDFGGQDTCQGDSGGPLQITKQENHCVFFVVGITSFGRSCGTEVPAIYTRVASFLDWIEPIVWG